MKKTYQVWCEDGRNPPMSHEYNIEVDGETSTLSFSLDKSWSSPGELVATLIDDGDGIVIKGIGNKKISLDYMQSHQLYVMLAHNNGKWKNEIKEIVTIKQF